MKEAIFLLSLISISGCLAGTIFPATVLCKNIPRWKVFIVGFFISALFISLLKFIDNYDSAPLQEGSGIIGVLVGFLWVSIAAIRLIACGIRSLKNKSSPKQENSDTLSGTYQDSTDSSDDEHEGSGAIFLFTYQDSKGNTTERTVSVLSVGRGYLRGICHLRSSIRTFKLERITDDVVDTATGEVVPVSGLSRYFRSHY